MSGEGGVPHQRPSTPRPRVLYADVDPVLGRFVSGDLQAEGFDVEVVADGSRAFERAIATRPDLMLLDSELPGLGGIEVLRRLRAHPPTSSLPVILLSDHALPAERVLGLTAGADDYVIKPFDTLELVARIRGVLRRTADHRGLSPLTGLPGNHRIDAEIAARAAAGTPYAVCHVDLDEFKAFNDAYGFQRGDTLLMLLATCLQDAAASAGTPPAFLGHVGGDDFIVVCTPEQAEPLAAVAVAAFDAEVALHYDPPDARRGWLEVVDRRGDLRRHPFVSVSIGIASQTSGDRDHRAVVAAANEMKGVAKTAPGSHVAVDRRS